MQKIQIIAPVNIATARWYIDFMYSNEARICFCYKSVGFIKEHIIFEQR